MITAPRLPVLLTATAGAAGAALFWLKPSGALTEILIFGAFLAALLHGRPAARLWLAPAGLAALLVAAYPLLQLPWTVDPAAAAADLARDLRLPAGVFALSFFAGRGARVDRVLFTSALVLLAVFAVDLVRVRLALGPEAFPEQARYYKPQALNHPNVSSLLAGACCLVCLYGAWTRRACRAAAAGFGLGALLSLAYLFVMASRGPQAAFAAAAGAAVLLAPRTWKVRAAALAAATAAALLLLLNLERVNARFLDRSDFFSGREAVWRHTAELARERPWFGYGYGKTVFQDVYYRKSTPPPSPHVFPHPHQHALFILFQGGRVWLILHGAFWLLLGAALLRGMAAAPDETARLRMALLASLAVLWLAYGMGDCPDNRLKLAMAALVPLALVAAAERGEPAADQLDSTRTRTSA